MRSSECSAKLPEHCTADAWQGLSVETGTLQWLVTGYMLMIGIVLPFSSLISKWFSTRQIIIFALADFTVGALISGFENSFGMLLFGRMIQESAPD